MSAYIIYNYKITNRDKIDELGPLSLEIIKKYEAILVVASPTQILEGSAYSNMVMYKFKSMEDAKDFYNCFESKELSKLRNEITEGFVVLVPEYAN